jgi:hypothetical protein
LSVPVVCGCHLGSYIYEHQHQICRWLNKIVHKYFSPFTWKPGLNHQERSLPTFVFHPVFHTYCQHSDTTATQTDGNKEVSSSLTKQIWIVIQRIDKLREISQFARYRIT